MACLSANSAWALGEVKKAPHVATEFEKNNGKPYHAVLA